jgi:hypothetical protein
MHFIIMYFSQFFKINLTKLYHNATTTNYATVTGITIAAVSIRLGEMKTQKI